MNGASMVNRDCDAGMSPPRRFVNRNGCQIEVQFLSQRESEGNYTNPQKFSSSVAPLGKK